MKALFLCVVVFLMLINCRAAIGSSVDFQPDQLCKKGFIDYPENLISAHEIDVNLDSISELLLFIQYNNNARFHLFHQADCGFKEVTDSRGDSFSFLSYASSSICQPIGCHELTFCADFDGLRHLVKVSGGHTLTLEQRHRWQAGTLPEKEITSQITITNLRLIDGKLIEIESRVVPNLLENIKLFDPNSHGLTGDADTVGFEISSCV